MCRNNIQHSANTQQQRNYADVNKSNTNHVVVTFISLTNNLDEFKRLFNQLLQQHSMILNMLTLLIKKNN